MVDARVFGWLSCIVAGGLATHAGFAVAATTTQVDARYLVDHWSTADGLPVNGINRVHVSRSGYLWLATFDGLVRFDGNRFTTFRSDPETSGLSRNRILHIIETGDGQIWAYAERRRLARFDGLAFRPVGEADGLPGEEVDGIKLDDFGTLWISTPAGLVRRTADDHFELLPGTFQPSVINHLRIPEKGVVWTATADGMNVFENGRLRRHLGAAEGIPLPTMSFTWDRHGRLWVVSNSSVVRENDQGGFQSILQAPGISRIEVAGDDMVIDTNQIDFTVRADGSIERRTRDTPFQGTNRETLVRHAPDGSLWRNRVDRLEHDGHVVFKPSCKINDFDFGSDGTIWVATACDGIYALRPRLISAITHVGGVALGGVYGMAQAADGSLWLGTLSQGVAILSPDGTVSWLHSRTGALGMGLHVVWIGPRDETWVGSCHVIAPAQCATAVDWPRAIGIGVTVQALHRARDGSLWVAGNELQRQLPNGEWQPLPPEAGLRRSNLGDKVRVILERADGSLWFGTHGSGVLRRDPAGRYRLITSRDGLFDDSIRALRFDHQGRLWVATEGRGLCRIEGPDSATPGIACIDHSRGLWSDSLHQILFDDEGRMWLNSNQGVFALALQAVNAVLDGQALRVYPQVYTEQDGLPSREGNGGVNDAGIRLADGRIAFPTRNGVALFDPHVLRPSPEPVRAVFERVSLPDGRERVAMPHMTLQRGTRNVTLHFTGLSPHLTAPAYFRYRLLPDSNWVELGDSRQLSLSRLPPGEHTVELVAFGSGGVVGSPARMTLAMPAYFHETSTFRVGVMLLLTLAAVAWMLLRARAAREQRQILLRTVDERTLELRNALSVVHEQRDEIARLAMSKTRFFANVSHELRTPLALLVGPIDDFARGRAPSKQLVAAMQRNAHRLERLIGQLLDLERIDARRFPLRPQTLDMAELVKESVTAFTPLAGHENIALQLLLPGHAVPVRGDNEQLMRVLGNLLSNALKFCPASGRVRVTLAGGESNVRVRVDDSGPGVQAEWRERIFDRFSQMGSAATRAREGTGLGLALCREVSELHGGRLFVEDSPLGGAGFVFELPIPERSPLAVASDSFVSTTTASAALAPVPQAASSDATLDAGTNPAVTPFASEVARPKSSDERPLVLLAEDNPDLRHYLAGVLAGTYRVAAAEDGKVALRLACAEPPDLVVTDLMMPGLDGLGLAQAIRADATLAGVPIVFLTARASDADRASGLDGGADHYLTKPFDSRVLLAQLGAALRACQRLRDHYARQTEGHDPAAEAVVESAFAAQLDALFAARAHDPDFGVPAIADALHMSEATLRRRCRDEGAGNPGERLRQHRLERARGLLHDKAGNVSEIAYAVGYASLSAFDRAYRARFGHAPRTPADPH